MSGKSGGRLLAILQVTGVAATGWFVWSDAVLPKLRWQSAASLMSEALFYVVLAWLCATAIAFGVYLVVSLADPPEVIRLSLRSAAPAMWFAPAFILLTGPPLPAAFIGSIVLIANATRLLISDWGVIESPVKGSPAPGGDAAVNPAPPMIGAALGQAGLVAVLWQSPLLAAALLAASTAILTSLALTTGAYRPEKPPALPHSLLSLVLTFLLAASLSYGGLRARRAGGPSAGGAGTASAPQLVTKVADPPSASMTMGGDFPGVILLPEAQPHATLVAPVLRPPTSHGVAIARPVGIPFTGEYWMFRWPAERPPLRSFIRHGRPTEISFHTTDGAPLQMEARQRLDPAISARCCSGIQLAIADSAGYSKMVSLELVLIDTETRLSQSLGTAALASGRVEQVLSYSMPSVTALAKFDEIQIIFRREMPLMDRSAKIAIERFVLVP